MSLILLNLYAKNKIKIKHIPIRFNYQLVDSENNPSIL